MQRTLVAVCAGVLLASIAPLAAAKKPPHDRPRVVELIGLGMHVFVDGVELVQFDSPVVDDLRAKPDVHKRGVTLGLRF